MLCRYRQQHAPDLFLGAYVSTSNGRRLIGYVSSTLSSSDHLTFESLEEHVPYGTFVCVQVVCVTEEYRGRGVALALLKEYIARLGKARLGGAPYTRVVLIARKEHRNLFEQAGFQVSEKSEAVGVSDPWYQMQKSFSPASESSPQTQTLPPGIWEALQRPSSRRIPVARLLNSFKNGTDDVIQKEDGLVYNKHDLLCPRNGCGSIILKNGVAALVERDSVQIDPPNAQSGSSLLPSLPPPGTNVKWWKITPNAMAFENVGFSRGVLLPGKILVVPDPREFFID